MLGYNLETSTKLVPFVHGGLGGMYTGLADIAEDKTKTTTTEKKKNILSSKLNAIGQVGIGTRYLLNKRTSLNLEGRFRHISNPFKSGDQKVDSFFMLFGLSYFY